LTLTAKARQRWIGYDRLVLADAGRQVLVSTRMQVLNSSGCSNVRRATKYAPREVGSLAETGLAMIHTNSPRTRIETHRSIHRPGRRCLSIAARFQVSGRS